MHPRWGGNRGRSNARGLALAWVAVLLPALVPRAARALPPTGDRIFYIKERSFLIPAVPDPGATGVQEVLLYVSEDNGRSYKFHASSNRLDEKFKFVAPGDGWYWFAVQTKDAAGRLFPPNLYAVPPGLKVCVDTLPPVIYVKQVATTEAAAAFEWDVREDNPDLLSLRADYRSTGDRDWLPLQIPPRLAGQFPWNPTGKGPWEVRLQMRDKAGNLGEQVTTIAAAGSRPDAGPAPPSPPRSNFVRVNSKQIQLNYKVDVVGKSDISTVEIWRTEDDGRTWKADVTNAPKQGPFTVTAPREGIFGFYVVPVSGVGLSEPPVNGTPPQVTVEVDLTPPVVNLLGPPLVGTGADLNKVTIRYQAADKNFGPTPIKILWRDAKVPSSEWAEVASNLTNEGFYVWNVPDSVPAHQFFIKVEAVDLAGNVGSAVTPVSVKVDPIKPKASIIGVEAVKALPP
jgi:hypothetical protein